MKDGMWEEMRRNAVILFEGVLLPQADMLMDWVQLSVVRGDFIFFLSLHHFARHFCMAINTSSI